jgi:DNA invertase Pin-like site-specific DNA recombinase
MYTRKSSEEGLEQGFNSLHAQREACEAYVLSQAGEGWLGSKTVYDDGGYSGGSMERPGLQALLADIRRGLVDVVVVYKVDRLTRSLADFARIVELFDAQGVSFVSVTQAFNTTTSMGRLTLNVLLSFAQFEREVTGERIRDKIAASKAKGLWMGGRPPLGYDARDRKLVVNTAEAELVRHIFARYLELGSVTALEPDLKARGIRSKRWINKQGREVGGAVFSRGALYHLLANPVYRGAIRHRDKRHEDAHPAIIEAELWQRVQARLSDNCPDHPETDRVPAEVFLRNLLHDDTGEAMRALHTACGARRYRYYVSIGLRTRDPARTGSLPRIAMGVLDRFVVDAAATLLAETWRGNLALEARVQAALVRVVLSAERVVLVLRHDAVRADAAHFSWTARRIEEGLELSVPIRLKHRQGAVLIQSPRTDREVEKVDRALVRAVCLANEWARSIAAGRFASTKELARARGYCSHYAARLMPLAWLAPDLVDQVLEGGQPRALTLAALTNQPLPLEWSEQRRLFDRFR